MTRSLAKIKAIGYDHLSILNDDIITSEDGTSFSWKGPFALLSNRYIPKNSKVYIELDITSPPNNRDIRHIPLCLGVHKEPSFGIMGSDCSLGAIYYTRATYTSPDMENIYLAFVRRDKFAARAVQYNYVTEITGRTPITSTVIGLGVDMVNNTIEIYTDGVLMYSWQPPLFHINEEDSPFYFCIYCPEHNEPVTGKVNFGRYRTKYLPEGYMDFYQQLFDRESMFTNIESSLVIKSNYENTFFADGIMGSVDIVNPMCPIGENNRRDIKIIVSDEEKMRHYKDADKTIVDYHGFLYHPDDDEIAYLEYPFGTNKRIYFEFHSSEATLLADYVGIPLTIGLTKDPTDLSKESLQINMAHLRVDGYHIYTVKDGYTFLAGNYGIMNPIAPIQPNIIGILVDLQENTIEIYTEGFLYTVIQPNLNMADFSSGTEPVYFFFKPDRNKFTGEGKCIVNIGTLDNEAAGSGGADEDIISYIDDDIRFDEIPDGVNVMTYWWYYNYSIRVTQYRDIKSTMKVISDRIFSSKNIFSSLTVTDPNDQEKEWGRGTNLLHGTYNKVSRLTDGVNRPNVSIFELKKIMEEDKNNNTR